MSDGKETDASTTTDETEGTEIDSVIEGSTETETEDTFSTGTYVTTDDSTETASTPVSALSIKEENAASVCHLRPQDFLRLEGRHLKAEDFEWATCPIPNLSEIVVVNADQMKICDLEKILTSVTTEQRNRILESVTTEQRNRILEFLPLDLPLKNALSLLEEGTYWKRMCLRSWPSYDVWRYSDNWKSMFVHRTVQGMVQDFSPDEDVGELCEALKVFTDYVSFLEIHKLLKVAEKNTVVDLTSESFDDQLDDIISAPRSPVYLDFEKCFECLTHLQNLSIVLSPKFIDLDDFHCNIADFNCLFRGLTKLNELTRLRISNGFLTNELLVVVAKTLLSHTCLKELNVSFNFIDDTVCDYLGKLLISECPLESLVLKHNKITDTGAKSIAAALVENSKLKKLDVSLNMVGDVGGQFLAKVLLLNKSMRDLDVSKNKMTSEAGTAFAEIVRESGSLRSLKIQENYLGEVAGTKLSDAIAENRSLLELDVHFCGFRNEDEGLIHEAILRNRLTVPYSTCKNTDAIAAEFLF